MDRLLIKGGRRLEGRLSIEGAKNALLPLMAASLLTKEPLHIQNAPPLSDALTMVKLLTYLGVSANYDEPQKALTLEAKTIATTKAPYDMVRKMRASILVLGPLLARHGHAHVSLPGGCAIGPRPVNLHIEALTALGAKITLKEGYIHAQTGPKGLLGSTYTFPLISVTGTANFLMASTLAKGHTTVYNAAMEPEITDLAQCLIAMGAKIEGLGTRTLHIEGVSSLQGAQHKTLPDRIETGTYILATAITGGHVFLENTKMALLPTFAAVLNEMGVHIQETPSGIEVQSPKPSEMRGTQIITGAYPDFPTDLQAQVVALLTLTRGESSVQETVFENRLTHVAELLRMGAAIILSDRTVRIQGRRSLSAASLMATDLRASACLVLAALAAKGESIIQRIYHLDRGYHNLEKKLAGCGAYIKRLRENNASHPRPSSHPST